MNIDKREMAVAVAKDVLQMLAEENNIQVQTGYYLSSEYKPIDLEGDLKDVLPKMTNAGCRVCAIGALLLSKARLYNQVPLRKIFYRTFSRWDCEEIAAGRCIFIELLTEIFSQRTLDLIEAAFEKSGGSDKYLYGAINFGTQYKDDKERLIAIMHNIIDHEGEFVVKPIEVERTDDE